MEWLRVGLVEELWLRSFGRKERGPQDDAGRFGCGGQSWFAWEAEEHRGDGQAMGGVACGVASDRRALRREQDHSMR